jgi:CRP/FNR family transcriptional regulator, cyclic AMP receptor protein
MREHATGSPSEPTRSVRSNGAACEAVEVADVPSERRHNISPVARSSSSSRGERISGSRAGKFGAFAPAPTTPLRSSLPPVREDDFLARLDARERAALDACGRRRRIRAGDVLFYEGDDGRDVHVLVSGLVKVCTSSASGREIILDVVDAGAVLGELSAIDGGTRSASAIALTEGEEVVIAIDGFLEFLDRNPGAATQLLSVVAARLRHTSQRQLEFGTSDALTRLCGCILTMVERYGGEGRQVALPVAQQDVAALTGLSREAVVKGMRALRDLGWIQARGRNVVILDEDALRSRATV